MMFDSWSDFWDTPPFSNIFFQIFLCWLGLVILGWIFKQFTKPGFKVDNKHVFITGGSTGLGLAFAVRCAKMGANISIVARNETKLSNAVDAIKAACKSSSQKVVYYSADVTQPDVIAKAVADSEAEHGKPIDVLFCNAGLSHPDYFLTHKVETFKKEMDLNYFGNVTTLKAALPGMVAQNSGTVVLTSSAMGLIGFAGYSTYASTKWAVRGLGECLRNEFKNTNINFHLFYPANMDTPGFAEENKTKPQETVMIEGTAATVTPDSAAKCLINGITSGNFHITNDIMVELLRWNLTGMSCRSNILWELPFTPILAVAGWGYVKFMDFCVWMKRKERND